MRAYLQAYEMISVRNLSEALRKLNDEPHIWKPFAGGTDIMVLFEAGALQHKKFINIWGIKELKGIRAAKDFITLGALTTYSEIQEHPIIKKEFSMLIEAARVTGAIAIQNRGTIGGNIVNASPAADTPPALLAYDAEIEIISKRGARWLPYCDFHQDYKKIQLKPDELLKSIRLRRDKGREQRNHFHYYRKVGTRKAQAISKVCFAALAHVEKKRLNEVRIGVGSVAPIPLRCFKTEQFLVANAINNENLVRAQNLLRDEISPINDIRSTADYRLTVAANLLKEFLCGIGSLNLKI